MARVNAKTVHTVRYVCMTTMTVLLMLQTAFYSNHVTASRPIATSKQKNLSFCDPINKNNITCCAFSIGKKKNSVYFVARGRGSVGPIGQNSLNSILCLRCLIKFYVHNFFFKFGL